MPTRTSKMSKERRAKLAAKLDDVIGFFNGGQRWVKKAYFGTVKGENNLVAPFGGVEFIQVEHVGRTFDSRDNRGYYPVKVDGVLRFDLKPEVACLAGGISLTVHERLNDVDSIDPKSILAVAILQAVNEPHEQWQDRYDAAADEVDGDWKKMHQWGCENPEPVVFESIPEFNDDDETTWPMVLAVLERAKVLILEGKV